MGLEPPAWLTSMSLSPWQQQQQHLPHTGLPQLTPSGVVVPTAGTSVGTSEAGESGADEESPTTPAAPKSTPPADHESITETRPVALCTLCCIASALQ
jgi:hypothetical protein